MHSTLNQRLRAHAAALLAAVLLLLIFASAGYAEQEVVELRVTSPDSAGPGTLNQAIRDANLLSREYSFKIIIEVPGVLLAGSLDMTDKTGWIKGRADATVRNLFCDLRGGASLTIEDLIVDNGVVVGSAIYAASGANALYLSGTNHITSNKRYGLEVVTMLEIDRAPGADPESSLTLGGGTTGASVYQGATCELKGGTIITSGSNYGLMAPISVTGGKLVASGGVRGILFVWPNDPRIAISGGNVVARGGVSDIASGGLPSLITGGSVDARTIELRPVDASGRLLYLVVVTVGAPPVADTEVSCSYNGGTAFSAYTDGAGKLYFWMPAGEGSAEIDVGGTIYRTGGIVAESDDNQVLAQPDPVVTGVTVTPSSVRTQRGATVQFTASVEGEHLPPQDVIWTVENGHAGTFISDTGLLTISRAETARTLVVTATSEFDPTQSGTAEVSVAAVSPAAVVLIAILLILLLLLVVFLPLFI